MEANQLLKDLEQLSLSHKSAVNHSASSEPDYIVDMSVQPSDNNPLIAAASSTFSIHLMPKDRLQTSSTIKGHKNTITKVQFCKSDPNLLYSSSKDKTLRSWDVRTSKQVQSFEIPATIDVELLSMDVSGSGRLLCAGTERVKTDSYILFWDSRQKQVLGCYSECHQDDITQISFQPGSDQHLASGSSDGLVCTFDLSETSEDDSLQTTSNAESDVSRLGWCGQDNSCVYAATTDSTFHVWDAFEGDPLYSLESLSELQNSKDKSSVDYILDCVPALTATDEDRSSVVLLAGTYSGDLKMLSHSEGEAPSLVCSLAQGHTAPLRCSHWDPQTKTLLTGAEDSLVCLWSVSSSLLSPVSAVHKDKIKGKVKGRASISSSGKKPYDRQKR